MIEVLPEIDPSSVFVIEGCLRDKDHWFIHGSNAFTSQLSARNFIDSYGPGAHERFKFRIVKITQTKTVVEQGS